MVKVAHGRSRLRSEEAYQSLPTALTKPNAPCRREVQTPTKPYQYPCSRCETPRHFRFGLPTLTRIRIWLGHRYRIVLPTLTSRGVKYTHDINCTVLHHDRGPLGLCVISQASTQKVIPVGDGGAKHRSIDPPTPRHNVPTRHAVATSEHGGLDPTVRSFWAYGVYSVVKASYFGKEFLRMAGIVQMLHAHYTPYDKYYHNAHRERKRLTQPRTQEGSLASMASAIP